MGRSKAPVMHQKHMRCAAIFQHVGNFTPDFGIAQLFIVGFSNGLYLCDEHLIIVYMMHCLFSLVFLYTNAAMTII